MSSIAVGIVLRWVSNAWRMDAKVFFLAVQLGSAPEDYDPVDLGDSSGDSSPDY